MKNLVVTDRDISTDYFQNSVIVNLNNIHYSSCTGGLSIISKWTNDCQLIIYITRVKYGCFDIPFKKMLERLVVNQEPFYTMVDGETCHLGLSQLRKKLLVIGYGQATDEEKKLFKDILDDSTLGYSYSSVDAYFCEESELDEVLRTFGGVDLG